MGTLHRVLTIGFALVILGNRAFSAAGPHYTTKTSDVKAVKLGKKGEEYPLVTSDKAALSLIRAKGKALVKKQSHQGSELIVVLAGTVTLPTDVELNHEKLSFTATAGQGIWVGAGFEHELDIEGTKATPAVVLVLHAPPDKANTAVLGVKDQGAPPVLTNVLTSVKELPIAGGKGSVKILFDKDVTNDASSYAGWIKFQKDAAVPEHAHANEEEVLWIVSGQGEMTIEGSKVPVSAGMAVAIPPNTKHSFTATTDVEAVQFYAPGGPEQRFKGTGK